MPPDTRESGGDPHRGAATPGVIAARTPAEADALPCPGADQDTTSSDHPIETNVLWPLVVTLGEIAQRVTQCAREEQHHVG